MTIPAQVTAAGLLIPTVEELLADLAADQKANVDPLIETDADSVVGQFNGIFASHFREAYEAILYGYDSIDRGNAEDARLDIVGELTGTIREEATYSTFAGTNRVTVNLNAGVTLAVGSRAHVLDQPDALFETTEQVTNSGGAPADVQVAMRATVTGPVHANAGTLTVIATPVVGWNSVTNAGDVALGKDTEADAAYRIRQEEELQQAGTSTESALHSNLLAMVASSDGITKPIISCVIIENDTDVTVNGVPPHGFEAVIWDGVSQAADNTDVATTIFHSKGLGIPTAGSVAVTIKDSAGNSKVIRFSRATQKATTIEVTLRYKAGEYVGDDAVKQALSDAFQGLTGPAQAVGAVVSFSQYMAVVQELQGVARIETWRMKFGTDPLVAFQDLTPASREVATLSTGSITVIATAL